MGKGPCKIATDPERDVAYVANSPASTLAVISLETGTPLCEAPVERAPVGVAVAPGRGRLYVCNRGAGSVSVLGAESRREWGRIPVGNAPGDCAVDPVTGRLFVSSAGSRSLVAIEDEHTGPSPLEPVPHPLLGRRLPSFALPEVRTGRMIQSLRWAERKYIVNFFASW